MDSDNAIPDITAESSDQITPLATTNQEEITENITDNSGQAIFETDTVNIHNTFYNDEDEILVHDSDSEPDEIKRERAEQQERELQDSINRKLALDKYETELLALAISEEQLNVLTDFLCNMPDLATDRIETILQYLGIHFTVEQARRTLKYLYNEITERNAEQFQQNPSFRISDDFYYEADHAVYSKVIDGYRLDRNHQVEDDYYREYGTTVQCQNLLYTEDGDSTERSQNQESEIRLGYCEDDREQEPFHEEELLLGLSEELEPGSQIFEEQVSDNADQLFEANAENNWQPCTAEQFGPPAKKFKHSHFSEEAVSSGSPLH